MKKVRALARWSCVFLCLTPLAVAQNEHAFVWSSATGMTDIGTLGGNNSYALMINDSGEVVGWSYLADNVTTHAFTWTPTGGMVDLGTLGGCCSQGQAINSSGDVAGDAIGSDGLQSPFYWSPSGGMVSLGVFTGDSRNYAFGVSDSSEVTGQVYYGEVVQAFLWSPTEPLHALGALPGGLHSVGTALNNKGLVVGTASDSAGSFTGMSWSHPSGMLDIGMIASGTYTAAQGVNDSNEIVGWGYANSASTAETAFYRSDTVSHSELATLGGNQTYAWGISQQGTIAGHSTLTGNTATHAVMWSDYTSAPLDLGTLPGGANSYARGLNNVGQVVGYADAP